MHKPPHKHSQLGTAFEADGAQLQQLLQAEIHQRKKLVALLKAHGIDPTEADKLSVSDDSADLPRRPVMLADTHSAPMPRRQKMNTKSRPSTWASMMVKQKVEADPLGKDLSHHLKGIATIMPSLPQVVVCFHHLKLSVSMPEQQSTKWSGWLKRSRETSQHTHGHIILNNLTGILQPGKTTLVMGALGSGTSSFLQVLSHVITKQTRGLALEGRVTYNGKTADSGAFVPYRVATYLGEHIPLLMCLTVDETLAFAHTLEDEAPSLVRRLRTATKAEGSFRSLLAKRNAANLVEKVSEKRVRVHEILQLASLDGCKHKLVRSLSPSEKRRVAICERFIGWQKVFMMDQITTGLDSYMSFELVRAVSMITKAFAYTTAIGIVQPPPELFELVEDVLILCKGSIIYHGPVAQVRQHFESLQLYCPPRRDLGDFLEEISETEGNVAEANRNVVPLLAVKPRPGSVQELVHRFRESTFHRDNQDTLRQAVHQLEQTHQSTNLVGGSSSSLGAAIVNDSLFSEEQRKKYLISWQRATTLAITRRRLVVSRNRATHWIVLMKPLFASVLAASLWFNLDKDKYASKFGLIFQTCLAMIACGTVGIAGMVEERPVFYSQRDARLLPAKSYIIGQALGVLHYNLFWIFLYLVPVYFLCGFSRDNGGARFWLFLCICFSLCIATAQLYRTIVSLCPNFFWVTGGVSVANISMTILSGFTVSESIIPVYWRWLFWLNPVAWAFRALVLVEFRSDVYSQPAASGNITLGDLYMDAYGFRKESHWVWGAIIYLWAFFFLQLILTWLIHKHVRHNTATSASRRKLQSTNNRQSMASNATENTGMASPVVRGASPALQAANSPALRGASPVLPAASPVSQARKSPVQEIPVVVEQQQKPNKSSTRKVIERADTTPESTNDILLTPAYFFETIQENESAARDDHPKQLLRTFERRQNAFNGHSTGKLQSSTTTGSIDEHHTETQNISHLLQSFRHHHAEREPTLESRQDVEMEDMRSPLVVSLGGVTPQQSGTITSPVSLDSTANSVSLDIQPTETAEIETGVTVKSPMTEQEGMVLGKPLGDPNPVDPNTPGTPTNMLAAAQTPAKSDTLSPQGPALMFGTSPVTFRRVSPTKQAEANGPRQMQLHLNHLPHFGHQESVLSPGVKLLEDLPFTPVSLVFKNIWKSVTSQVKDHKESLDVLQGVTGFALPGTVTAIMGSPGSAKSTLLDTIGSIQDDSRIFLNGHAKQARWFSHISGFVHKSDTHPRFVTVREYISFNTQLRLPHHVQRQKKENFVDFVLHQLGLTEDQHELLGGLMDEQTKLLSMATQLSANPAILFIDEPTSDLHSHSAGIVVNATRRIARTNRSIVCTIHQPSAHLLQMFDQMLLLTKSGRVAYFGPVGEDFQDLISFFGRLPKCPRMHPGANPATFALDVLANPELDVPGCYEKSTQKKINERTLLRLSRTGTIPSHANQAFVAPLWVQAQVLSQRALKSFLRSPGYGRMRLLMGSIGGLVCGSVWARSNIDSQTTVFGRVASISMMCGFLASIHGYPSLDFSFVEVSIYLRERQQHLYSTWTYALAFFFSELPFLITDTLLFSVSFYFIVGLDSKPPKFAFFCLFYLLMIGLATLLGQLIGSTINHNSLASFVLDMILGVLVVFGGLTISPADISEFWLFLYWISPYHYLIEGTITTQFQGMQQPIEVAVDGQTQIMSVEEYVNFYFGGEFVYEHRWRCAGALLLSWFVVWLLRVGILRYRFRSSLHRN